MLALYKQVCYDCSKVITHAYSTSFSLGIKALDKKMQAPIYALYGYVRLADEIVDTFHNHDKQQLLNQFKTQTFQAIEQGISLNPILQAFQEIVKTYNIDHSLINSFLNSMEMDLNAKSFNQQSYDNYVYGSAEVVGLMCLKIFVHGNKAEYDKLKDGAQALGSAFQKVNFLRDLKSDYEDLGRIYFPDVNFNTFTCKDKSLIEADIQQDFDKAYKSILQLPKGARFGVYTAYRYYLSLFEKIKQTQAAQIKQIRIRIPNQQKMVLLVKSALRNRLGILQS